MGYQSSTWEGLDSWGVPFACCLALKRSAEMMARLLRR
jgi:hypothetical protein